MSDSDINIICGKTIRRTEHGLETIIIRRVPKYQQIKPKISVLYLNRVIQDNSHECEVANIIRETLDKVDNHLKNLRNKSKSKKSIIKDFIIFWLDGVKTECSGIDATDAFVKSGYTLSELKAVDFICLRDDSYNYRWDAKKEIWKNLNTKR